MHGKFLLILFAAFLLLLPTVSAFSGSEGGYQIHMGNVNYGAHSTTDSYRANSVLTDQPVGRYYSPDYDFCLGAYCMKGSYVYPINITPYVSYTNDTLDCGFTVHDADIEDNLTVNVTWYRDNGTGFVPWSQDNEYIIEADSGVPAHTGSLGDVEPGDTARGNEWICSVVADDGTHTTGWINSSILTIQNAPALIGIIKTYYNGSKVDKVYPGDLLTIKVNVTDIDGREEIDSVILNITDSNTIKQVLDELMDNTTLIPLGYTYEYDYQLPVSAVSGLWAMDLRSNDTVGLVSTGKGNFTVIISGLTIQLYLTLNNTSNMVYVPGTGEISAGDISGYTVYPSPEHYYLASYADDTLYSLIFSEMTPLMISLNSSGSSHILGLDQSLAGSQTFLVFSRRDWREVESRMPLVESGEFLGNIEPTFGFGLGADYPIKLMLNYTVGDIDINGSLIARKGTHNVSIESTQGVVNDRLVIDIKD